ncbi:hypothetical protein [Niabella drilacis]|uniref:Outer membrane protein beta-barrel domain-containing protein n=1 Tax=Niabella drilacis (strain DSM 25811 / CCM 8410 / CCUG 62505 / LMG 26954 / E90) TaxID=1285928 RepID=A0A1G6J3S3_NIADE|nr:hypothetical protein [Niabella drilacis]SDC13279.1 hypothetical protein SAMN04487894_101409 [Niabella drilacis]
MRTLFLFICCIIHITATIGQGSTSPFRKGYIRLGIQLPGKSLDHMLSPKENMVRGNFGNDIGFNIEKGHIFYFIPAGRAKTINAGLDWTVISVSGTPTAKSWKNYTRANTSYVNEDFTSKLFLSLATKAGPVVSINPVQDLVIDVRVQASLGVYGLGPVYEHYADDRYDPETLNAFYPYPYDEEATGIKPFTQAFHAAIRPNIGASVKWRSIGLAADYSPGNINMKYREVTNGAGSTGEQKITMNTFQVKLSLQGKK